MLNDALKKLINLTLLVTSTALLTILLSFFYLDLLFANFFNQDELKTVYYYSREITNIGYSIHYFAIALIGFIYSKWIYSNSLFFKKRMSALLNLQINQWSVFSFKALALGGLSVNILKMIIGRNRPHSSENFYPLNFNFFNLDSHWHSLPSGHAQVLFTVAAVALLIWPKYKHLFLVLALILTFTRVTTHQHFFSDVIAGAAVGYLGTLWLYFLWPPKIY